MARWWRWLLLCAVAVSPAGVATACDSCGDVNCGAGLIVWWRPNAVPDGTYEVCFESRCEGVGVQSRGGVELVEPSIDGAGDVTLRVTTPDGSTTEYSGSGSLHGDCCKAVILQAGPVGQLLDEQFD